MPNFPSVNAEGTFESPEVNEKIKGIARDAVDTSTFAAKSDLENKANSDHDHAIQDVNGLQSALDGKQSSGNYASSSDLDGKADTSHTHAVGDITGLQSALNGKQESGDYATKADLNGKQDSGSYATQADVESLESLIADLTGRIEALETPAE